MNKKTSLILFVIGLILLSSGLVSSFVVGFREDKAATQLRMVNVEDVYETFQGQMDTFNDIRNHLYLTVFEDVYYDTLYTNDLELKKSFEQYEGVVDQLSNTADQLMELCSDVYFSEKAVNTMCKGYPEVYEQVINAFVSDVFLYNDNIEQYNQYQTDAGSSLSIEKYVTDKDYIDYNGDKEYSGKE